MPYFLITIQIENNKPLYLTVNKNDKCTWTLNVDEALWFRAEYDAQRTAKKYLKHFDKWEIVDIETISKRDRL